MDNKLIEDIVNEILQNEKFKNDCKDSINAILKTKNSMLILHEIN